MSRRLERTTFRAIGTTCAAAVTARPRDARHAQRALEAARAEVDACEEALSRFLPASDLSRLNAAGGAWSRVDVRLLEALRLSLRAREDTRGRFDPTILPALVAAGYDRSFEQLAERPARRVERWRAGAAIELDETAGRARLEAGAAVDLGGIGKGYAAARALSADEGRLAVVARRARRPRRRPRALGHDAGGWAVADCRGRPPPRRNDHRRPAPPRGGRRDVGSRRPPFRAGGSLHHLIDPSTGEPAEPGPLAVTVLAPDAAEAEAHATALGISTAVDAAAHVAAHPRISAVFVPHDGEPLLLGRPPVARSRILVRAA